MSFDWQTEDGINWDEPDFASSDLEKKPRGKRPFPRWLLLFGLLLVALVAAGLTLRQRVQMGTAQVEADILASQALVAQAVAQKDADLLQTVLSGRDGEWSMSMTRLVAAGQLTERGGLGLTPLPPTEAVTPTIELTADLLTAEVTTALPYAIDIGNGLTETVFLAQTAVYRAGSNRWLLTPADGAYWQGVRQLKGRYVTLFYPERDKTIAQSLLLSLDEKIGQLCAQFQDVVCPADYQMIVELTTDPAELAQMDLLSVIKNVDQRHLMLPTPTLVGLPQNKAAEQALFRGYGRLVVAAMLTDLWQYRCCDDSVALYVAVLENRLRQVGLQAWPGKVGTAVTPEAYDLLLETMPPLFADLNSWGEVHDDSFRLPTERAEALVVFAQKKLGIHDGELVQSLHNLGRNKLTVGGLFLAILSIKNITFSVNDLDIAWRSFVYENSSAAQQ